MRLLAALISLVASSVDGFVFLTSCSKSVLFKAPRPPSSSLPAVIYMPDGEVVHDDGDDLIETQKAQTSDALLNHLNSPDMRGPLAVLAAANENIDITTIEHISVQAVTPSAIHIEAVCTREDMHCVNVLASIDFPEDCKTNTDGEILDALGVLYQQANALLERKKVKTGTVVSFNAGRGFGFIAMDDGSEDAYVHYRNIKMDGYRQLKNGERVEFKTGIDTRRGTGRQYAFDVMPLGSGDSSEGLAKKEGASGADVAAAAQKAPQAQTTAAQATSGNVDLSIPYDAAAQLAYESSDKSTEYSAFREKFEEDAIADVIAKKIACAKQVDSKKIAAEKAEAEKAAADGEAKRTAEEKIAAENIAVKEKRTAEEATAAEPADAEGEAKRYASMDLEERAFNILLDLGMIVLTPDPDSPDYDSSKDDEFAPENVFIDL